VAEHSKPGDADAALTSFQADLQGPGGIGVFKGGMRNLAYRTELLLRVCVDSMHGL
jgi:hypothetical protein